MYQFFIKLAVFEKYYKLWCAMQIWSSWFKVWWQTDQYEPLYAFTLCKEHFILYHL